MEKTALQLEMDATYKKYEELREAVEEEKRSVIIPELKAQYERKYFKEILDRTIIYSFVTSVNNTKESEVIAFRLPTDNNQYYFEYTFGNNRAPDYVLQEEITKEEFYEAYRKLYDKVKSLFK